MPKARVSHTICFDGLQPSPTPMLLERANSAGACWIRGRREKSHMIMWTKQSWSGDNPDTLKLLFLVTNCQPFKVGEVGKGYEWQGYFDYKNLASLKEHPCLALSSGELGRRRTSSVFLKLHLRNVDSQIYNRKGFKSGLLPLVQLFLPFLKVIPTVHYTSLLHAHISKSQKELVIKIKNRLRVILIRSSIWGGPNIKWLSFNIN